MTYTLDPLRFAAFFKPVVANILTLRRMFALVENGRRKVIETLMKTPLVTHPLCPLNDWRQCPVDKSHTLAVRSAEAVNTRVPVGEKQADKTVSVWPEKVCKHSPWKSQTLAVASSEHVKIDEPCHKKSTPVMRIVWPTNVATKSPELTFQIVAVAS